MSRITVDVYMADAEAARRVMEVKAMQLTLSLECFESELLIEIGSKDLLDSDACVRARVHGSATCVGVRSWVALLLMSLLFVRANGVRCECACVVVWRGLHTGDRSWQT